MSLALGFEAKAPRILDLEKKSAGNDVEPSFIASTLESAPNYVAFNSLVERKVFEEKKSISSSANYEIEQNWSVEVAKSAFKSKTQRFPDKIVDPLPIIPETSKPIIPCKRAKRRTNSRAMISIANDKMQYNPSIPPKVARRTYASCEQDPDSFQMPIIPLGYVEQCYVSPAYYNPSINSTRNLDHSPSFGRKKTAEKLLEYFEEMKIVAKPEFEADVPPSPVVHRERRSRTAWHPISRSNAIPSRSTVTPSPGDYEITTFDPVLQKLKSSQCFGSSSGRFSSKIANPNDVPGPGYYDQPLTDAERIRLECYRRQAQSQNSADVGFLGSSVRFFDSKDHEINHPDISPMCTEERANEGFWQSDSFKQQPKTAPTGYGFGSALKRFSVASDDSKSSASDSKQGDVLLLQSSLIQASGANVSEDYWIRSNNDVNRNKSSLCASPSGKLVALDTPVISSSFTSKTVRFCPETETQKFDTPPPGYYSPKMQNMNGSNCYFGRSKDDRFNVKQNNNAEPGPGQYTHKHDVSKQTGGILKSGPIRDFEFVRSNSQIPGPGSYHQEFQLKKTFNIQIAIQMRKDA